MFPMKITGKITCKPISAKLTRDTDWFTKMSPYVNLIAGANRTKSKICKAGGLKPVWDDTLIIQCTTEDKLYVEIWDDETFGKNELIAVGEYPVSKLLTAFGYHTNEWTNVYFNKMAAGQINLDLIFQADNPDLLAQMTFGMQQQQTGMGMQPQMGFGMQQQPGMGMGMQQQGMGMGMQQQSMGMGMQQPGMGMGMQQQGMGMGMQQPGMGMQQPGYGMQQPGYGMQQPGMLMKPQVIGMQQQPGMGMQQQQSPGFGMQTPGLIPTVGMAQPVQAMTIKPQQQQPTQGIMIQQQQQPIIPATSIQQPIMQTQYAYNGVPMTTSATQGTTIVTMPQTQGVFIGSSPMVGMQGPRVVMPPTQVIIVEEKHHQKHHHHHHHHRDWDWF